MPAHSRPDAPSHVPASDQDEEDFDHFTEGLDPVDLEAGLWVARQRGGLDHSGQAALDAWLAADPRHQAAFDDMTETAGRLADVPEEQVDLWREALRPVPSVESKGASWWSGCLHWFPHGALATAVVAASALFAHRHYVPEYVADYRTQPGQSQQVTLPDGSRLELDTDTVLHFRLYAARREIRLDRGQAMFDVESDPGRPFRVDAGMARMTVLGTRFSVRRTASGLDEGDTRLAVVHGRVLIEGLSLAWWGLRRQTNGQSLALTAGQTVQANHSGRLGNVREVSPQSIGTWQNGRLQFTATPLATALAEFARYGHDEVVLNDARLAALPVGGSFSQQNLAGFLKSLEVQLPVRVVRQGQQWHVLPRS